MPILAFLLPHANDLLSGINKHIMDGIETLAILGALCVLIAVFNLFREKSELDKVLKKYKDGAYRLTTGEVKEITKGLKPDSPKGNLVHLRLRVIADMVESSGKNNNLTPQMGDLHQLSEQAIVSRWAPTGLRIITATLLICGICGTLWGVHDIIQNRGLGSDLSIFAPALEPSKWAVLVTIIFTLIRGLYTAAVDRFLWSLDRETMIHFLPDLIPNTELGEQATKLADAINTFNGKVETSMEPIKKASNEILSNSQHVSQLVDKITGSERRLDTLLGKVSSECTKLSEEQTSISSCMQRAEERLLGIESGIKLTKQLNTDLQNGINTFMASIEGVQDSVDTSTKNLLESTKQVQGLADRAGKLDSQLASIGNVNKTAQNLSDTIYRSVTDNEKAFSAFKGKLGEASGIINANKEAIDNIAAYAQSLESSSQEAITASGNALQEAKKIRTYATDFKTYIHSRNEELSQTKHELDTSQKQLVAESVKIRTALSNILTAAKKLDDRLPRPTGNAICRFIKRIFGF